MIFNPLEVYKSLINERELRSIRYLVHEFSSGIKMIDIWHEELFYVVQIQHDFVGMSLIDNDNPGFDTNPDVKFFDAKGFVTKLRDIFEGTANVL